MVKTTDGTQCIHNKLYLLRRSFLAYAGFSLSFCDDSLSRMYLTMQTTESTFRKSPRCPAISSIILSNTFAALRRGMSPQLVRRQPQNRPAPQHMPQLRIQTRQARLTVLYVPSLLFWYPLLNTQMAHRPNHRNPHVPMLMRSGGVI